MTILRAWAEQTWTKAQMDVLREACAGRPEGAPDSPWVFVKMTPAAVVLLMELYGQDTIDAVIIDKDEP